MFIHVVVVHHKYYNRTELFYQSRAFLFCENRGYCHAPLLGGGGHYIAALVILASNYAMVLLWAPDLNTPKFRISDVIDVHYLADSQ
jgi:hypothetical protein